MATSPYSLRCLLNSDKLALYYDATQYCLLTEWKGVHDAASVQEFGLCIFQHLQTSAAPKYWLTIPSSSVISKTRRRG